MVSAKDIVRHELIGLFAEVEKSSNPFQTGMSGRVVDETRQTLTIETAKGPKTVAKDQCVFVFSLPSGGRVRVDGKLLVARPEDRIKKKHGKW